MQALIVAVIVAACASYSTWSLMPAAWRQRLARRLLQWPALAGQAWLQRAAAQRGGCGDGCSSCDAGAAKPAAPGARQVIRIHRR